MISDIASLSFGRIGTVLFRVPTAAFCALVVSFVLLCPRRTKTFYCRYGFSIMGGDLPRELREEVDMSSANLADRRDCSPVYISKIKPNTPADGKVKVRVSFCAHVVNLTALICQVMATRDRMLPNLFRCC